MSIRLSTDVDWDVVERLQPRSKAPPRITVELRHLGERVLRSVAHTTYCEVGPGGVELVLCLGERPTVVTTTGRQQQTQRPRTEEQLARDAQVLELRRTGLSYTKIAEQLGMGRYAVEGIVRRAAKTKS